MYFSNVSELMVMGGHGFYVWLAFGFSAFWLTYLLLSPLIKKNHLLETIRSQQLIEEHRKSSNP